MAPIADTCVNCDHASEKSTFPKCKECESGKPNEYPNWEPKKPEEKEPCNEVP